MRPLHTIASDHGSRSRRLGIVAAVLTFTTAAAAGAAAHTQPQLSQMALRASDLPHGTGVIRQHYVNGSGGRVYVRDFDVGGIRRGRAGGAFVESVMLLEDDRSTTRADLRAIGHSWSSRAGRRAIAREVVAASGRHSGVTTRDVRFRSVRRIGAGDRALVLRFSVRTRAGRLHAVAAGVIVDRVLGLLDMTAAPRSHLQRRTASLLRAMAAHMREGLSPRNTVPPAISGVAAVGQTLNASSGTWDPATPPTALAYQWQRCDASGAACGPIAGANQPTYTVVGADVGSRLRVEVTATDAAGRGTALSPFTAAVP
jgi:hypothetical protein